MWCPFKAYVGVIEKEHIGLYKLYKDTHGYIGTSRDWLIDWCSEELHGR